MKTVAVERRPEADRINADLTLSAVPIVLDRIVIVAATGDSAGATGSGTGRTLTLERVSRLPLDNARDLAAIAALTPGVVSTAPQRRRLGSTGEGRARGIEER